MIQQLKKLFPSIHICKSQEELDTNYEWFLTNEYDIIGILKEELSEKDKTILSTFLQPYQINFPMQTTQESQWNDLIFHSEKEGFTTPFNKAFRFVHFHIEQDQIDPITFKESIEELFGKEMAILWESENEGIIIEEYNDEEELIDYTQIIDILMSDLYVKIKFYVGQFQYSINGTKQYYYSVIEGAKTAYLYLKSSVTTYIDIIPFILIDQTDQQIRSRIANLLKDFHDDEETLKMIETFINCNLNITVTAKELYMHRNSFQYRLDRFIEKTNIDIRQFPEAMAVYLALIAAKSL